MAKLILVGGPQTGRQIELQEDVELLIGRSGDCDVALDDSDASRHHCKVVYRDGKLRVKDLNSRNGTFVQGRRIEEALLETGDVLEVGDTKLQFLADRPARADQAPAVAPAKRPVPKSKDPFIGKTLGGYKLLARLGEGRLGISYKASHEFTESVAVVKILPPAMADKENIVKRFLRQAKAGAELNHPNVVQTLTAGQEGSAYYIVTEYVKGRSMQDMLDEQGEHGTLDPALTLDIMLQIGRALEHAYKHGIVHRHIKPRSIMVAADGTAKLDNLCLAKHIEGTAAEEHLSMTGKALGTLGYMPPEQLEDAKSVD